LVETMSMMNARSSSAKTKSSAELHFFTSAGELICDKIPVFIVTKVKLEFVFLAHDSRI